MSKQYVHQLLIQLFAVGLICIFFIFSAEKSANRNYILSFLLLNFKYNYSNHIYLVIVNNLL